MAAVPAHLQAGGEVSNDYDSVIEGSDSSSSPLPVAVPEHRASSSSLPPSSDDDHDDVGDANGGMAGADTDAAPTPEAAPPRKRYAEDFEFGDALGEGSFGLVVKATEIETGREFAIKIVSKALVAREKKIKYVHTERDLLTLCAHPSVVRLFYTFSGRENLYFVLELAANGELLTWLRKLGRFPVDVARFYTAEIADVLSYLHSLDVIHRDMKPENILLDANFHIRLTDFGTAKKLEIGNTTTAGDAGGDSDDDDETKGPQARSFLGTAEYVSPELLSLKYTCKSSDMWGLGCIIYQLVSGILPFHAATDYLIFRRIQERDLVYPEDFPPVVKNLLEEVLVLNPDERLGFRTEAGYDEFRAHEWFDGVDWEGIVEGEAPNLSLLTPVERATVPDPKTRRNKGAGSTSEAAATTSTAAPAGDAGGSGAAAGSGGGGGGGEADNTRAQQLEMQRESAWADFVADDELIIKNGLVVKRRKVSSKKRMLILTDHPRLIYVDPKKNEVKGEIPWSQELRAEKKNDKQFYVHTPDRRYNLTDLNGNSTEWVIAITEVVRDSA